MKQTPLSRASEAKLAAALRAGSTFTGPRTGLARGGQLERHQRMRPVSVKRAAENRLRRQVVDALWPQRPPCGCGENCGLWADDVHEILSRGRGGSITAAVNLLPLARVCHMRITDNPDHALKLGVSVHSWDAAPAQRRGAA